MDESSARSARRRRLFAQAFGRHKPAARGKHAAGHPEFDEGRIRFPGSRRLARWLRWTGSDDPQELLHVLMKSWQLPPPSSLVSVIGTVDLGDGEHTMHKELLLRRGLRRVLEKTQGWLITSGTRDGLGALVGSAVHGTTLPCIAILPWDAAAEHEYLQSKGVYNYGSKGDEQLQNRPAQLTGSRGGEEMSRHSRRRDASTPEVVHAPLRSESSVSMRRWHSTRSLTRRKSETNIARWKEAVAHVRNARGISQHRLEHNHTHFLFVDHGVLVTNASSADLAWYELKTRRQLEQAVCSTDLAGDGVMTPMLTMLVGGDMATLQLAANRLESGMPVLVLPDTGGIASELWTWALHHESPIDHVEDSQKAQLIQKVLHYADEKNGDMPRLSFLELNVDDIDAENVVDLTLTQAILNKCNDGIEQVMLSVAWGDLGILEEVLEKTAAHSTMGMSMALQLALLRSDARMVETLIDFNASPRFFDLERFFTQDRNVLNLKGSTADCWVPRNTAWKKSTEGSSPMGGQQHKKDRQAVLFTDDADASTSSRLFSRKGDCNARSISRKGSSSSWSDSLRPSEIKEKVRESRFINKWRGAAESLAKYSGPWNILGDWADGYKYHLEVRRSNSILEPNWTDMMLWAVLTGEKNLVRICWSRSNDPLRASVLASQLLRKLSSLPHLRADQWSLRQQADLLEDDALSLLDAIPEPARAMPLIAMVPCITSGQPLWQQSILDTAAHDEGVLFACMRFVAHRHSQQLLEAFFSGDFPTSRARIPPHSSLLKIIFQAIFFFLPGTFCEVMPSSGVLREEMTGKHVVYPALDEDISLSNEDDDEASDLDEEELDAFRVGEHENTLQDLIEDIRSQRWFFFFVVPKVKFVMYLTCHLCQLMLLSVVVFASQEEITGTLSPRIHYSEVAYWMWSFLFFAAELKEFKDFGVDGITQYFRSTWNKIDLSTVALVTASMVLRLKCSDVDISIGATSDQSGVCRTLEVWSRNTYSIVLSLLCFKILSYGTYFESVGVYIIILGEVARRDVSVVFSIILVVSSGVGLTFTLLMSRYNQTIEPTTGFSRPIFTPLWSLVGYFNEMDIPAQVGNEEPTRITMPTVLLFYLVAVIVLINLLIASMTETYQKVKESAELYWLFERSQLIHEFKRKGALPPPLNIFTLLLYDAPLALRSLLLRCGSHVKAAHHGDKPGSVLTTVRDGFAMVPGPTQMRRFVRRMQLARKRSATKSVINQRQTLEFQVNALSRQLEEMMNQQQEQFDQLAATVHSYWLDQSNVRRQSCDSTLSSSKSSCSASGDNEDREANHEPQHKSTSSRSRRTSSRCAKAASSSSSTQRMVPGCLAMSAAAAAAAMPPAAEMPRASPVASAGPTVGFGDVVKCASSAAAKKAPRAQFTPDEEDFAC
ncbi:hypothetical protein AB1Y20_007378 [Prymnesium parvum]|uniref:Ion transport domain-containing protein n=1 Tax=Prymnesium parvum TaxID=97485 RepID=A0AB34IXU8_PRYPA